MFDHIDLDAYVDGIESDAEMGRLFVENDKLKESCEELLEALKSSFAGKPVACADEIILRAENLLR